MQTLRKTLNGVILDIQIYEHENPSSETKFFNIHFSDKNNSKHCILHIWFSLRYLETSPEAININFEEIIENEINELLANIWEKLFEEEVYRISYSTKWKSIEKFDIEQNQ